MDFLTSDAFVTIFSVVGSAMGLFLALRADIGKRIDRTEDRIDRVEDRLGKRIDRVEDRARADHLALVAEISELKSAVSVQVGELNAAVGVQIGELKSAVSVQIGELNAAMGVQIGELNGAVSVLGAKLDERSGPQRLVVQEPPGDYTVDEEQPEGSDPEP